MNRTELAKQLAKNASLTIPKAEKLIVAFGNAVYKALSNDQKVVYSNFGTFYKVHYPSKVIFHPKLGKKKQMIMLPTDAVKWMPSGNIKDLVNSGTEIENAVAHGTRKKTLPLVKRTRSSALNESDKEELNVRSNQLSNIKSGDSEAVDIPIKTKTLNPITSQTSNEDRQNQPVNIYEELMHDGSKEVATFKDAIRLHKNKKPSLLGRLFNKNDENQENNHVLENKEKTAEEAGNPPQTSGTPVGSGIFDGHVSQALPIQKNEASAQTASPLEDDPEATTIPINVTKSTVAVVDPVPEPTEISVDPAPLIEKKISPFETDKANVIFVDLSKLTIPKELLQIIPEKLARKYKLVPIEQSANKLTIAMADPQDLEAREMVKKISQKEIVVKLASDEDINHIFDQYSGFESELNDAIQAGTENETNKDLEDEKSLLMESASDNAPAARIVTSILRRAVRDKASDIHIEPSEKEVDVRFRQDGILRKTVKLPKDIQAAVVSRIKIMSNLKIDEQRLPQDGRFSITYDNRKVDFRISTMPVANGEKVVMRVLDKLTGILTIDQLGIKGQGFEILNDNIKKSHGMTLVTGPTGSGKTTTLYALIDTLYSEGVNIVTLEDPIEYRMPGINQSQVNSEIDYTFASGLRSIVRQDPDIIMIGEIRDGETAEMAVHAALTGHVVLSTLHTNDAAGAVPRLLDMGVEPFLLTSSINTVIAQRLARKICDDCKEELKIPEEELASIKEEVNKMPEKVREDINKTEYKFYHGKGCKLCNNTGYKGRIGLYEVLGITEILKEMILRKESSFKIEEQAIADGMVTMIQDGILKALEGVTTIEEVWRITKE